MHADPTFGCKTALPFGGDFDKAIQDVSTGKLWRRILFEPRTKLAAQILGSVVQRKRDHRLQLKWEYFRTLALSARMLRANECMQIQVRARRELAAVAVRTTSP